MYLGKNKKMNLTTFSHCLLFLAGWRGGPPLEVADVGGEDSATSHVGNPAPPPRPTPSWSGAKNQSVTLGRGRQALSDGILRGQGGLQPPHQWVVRREAAFAVAEEPQLTAPGGGQGQEWDGGRGRAPFLGCKDKYGLRKMP